MYVHIEDDKTVDFLGWPFVLFFTGLLVPLILAARAVFPSNSN